MENTYLIVGEILKPQGLRGEIKVRPITNDPNRFHELDSVYMKKGDAYVPRKMACKRVHDGFVYITMEDITSCEDVEPLRGMLLYVDRDNAVELGEEENFICDLVGCTVENKQGEIIGTLREVLQPGANDVYVIKAPQGDILLPALKRVVVSVDVERKRICVDEEAMKEVAVYSDTEAIR